MNKQYITISLNQLTALEKKMHSLVRSPNQVSEIDFMHNPIAPEVILIRYKAFHTTEEGGIATEIVYNAVDRNGKISDAVELFGENFYPMLRDYIAFNLNNPLIKMI